MIDVIEFNLERVKIIQACFQYKIIGFIINDDLTIDVKGNVNLNDKNLTVLPIRFRNVYGSFSCSSNYLSTFDGFPIMVSGDFFIKCNEFSSLDGFPTVLSDNRVINMKSNNFPAEVKSELINYDIYAPNNDELRYNMIRRLNVFVKYQDHYGVWDNNILNLDCFIDIMNDIYDGLL